MVTEPSVKTPPAEKELVFDNNSFFATKVLSFYFDFSEFPHNLSVPDTSTTTSSFLGTDTQSLPAKIDPPPGLSRQVPPQVRPMCCHGSAPSESSLSWSRVCTCPPASRSLGASRSPRTPHHNTQHKCRHKPLRSTPSYK